MSKSLCVLACAALGLAALSAPARAVVAPSRERVETRREKGLRRVKRMLDQKAVRGRLARMGMSREEIERRLEKLDDAEVERLAERLEDLGAGRGSLGVVVGVLVVATLILLIIYLVERV